MDISFSNAQNAYREKVRSWISDNLPPNWVQAGQWPTLSEEQEQKFLID